MLGEQIAELKGKIMGQMVFDTEGRTMETSISFTGTINRAPLKETVTFVGRLPSGGVLHGKRQGIEMATFTAEASGGVARISIGHHQVVNWHFLTILLEYLNPRLMQRET